MAPSPDEVINPHFSSSSCSLLNQDRKPWTRSSHKQVGLTVCGGSWSYDWGHEGSEERNCETFADSKWQVSHNLLEERHGHSMWQSPEGILVMGGGNHDETTSELLQNDGTTVHKFTLPYGTKYVF